MFVVPGKLSEAGRHMRFVHQETCRAGHRLCPVDANKLASLQIAVGGLWIFTSMWQYSLGAGSVGYRRITELKFNHVRVEILRFTEHLGGPVEPPESYRLPAVPMTYSQLIPRRRHVRST